MKIIRRKEVEIMQQVQGPGFSKTIDMPKDRTQLREK